jgi:hypothetical protein
MSRLTTKNPSKLLHAVNAISLLPTTNDMNSSLGI